MNIGEHECSLSSVSDLSVGNMVQRQIEKGYFKEVKPVNPVKISNVIEFIVSGDGEEFTDLANTYLKTTLRVKKTDGTNLTGADKVSIVNYIGATLFSKIDVMLNDTQISSSTPNNAYRAILEALLTYDGPCLESQMQAAGFYKDTAGKMDAVDPSPTDDAETNTGLKERFDLIKESKAVEFIARIHADIFSQPKMLVNGVRMRLKFHRNKNEFCLMSATNDYTLQIEDISLMIRKCKLSAASYTQIVNMPAIYPTVRVITKDYSFANGIQSINMNNVASGVLPQRIVMSMVANAAVNGSTTLNPFNFQNFGLRECNVVLNGSTINGKSLTFDFENSIDADGYWSLFQSTGKMHHNIGSVIARKDYKDGYAIFVFDLSSSLCDGEHIDPDKSGDLSIGLTFKQNLTTPITVLLYLEYNSIVEITKGKKVIPHFQV